MASVVNPTRTIVPLMKEEYAFGFMNEAGVTTTNFFTGSIDEASTYYKERLILILRKNPWLAGKLEKDAKNSSVVNLSFRSDIDESVVDTLLVIDKSLDINRKMSYEQICEVVSLHKGPGGFVENGYAILKSGDPISKFTLSPDSTNGGFVFMPSISHVAGDGHTYFKILSMLVANAEPFSLEVCRQQAFRDAHMAIVGKEQYAAVLSTPLIMNFMGKMIFGCGRCKVSSFFVDPAKVEALKGLSKAGGDVPFVSTADIITSHFAVLTAARFFLYAVNLRSRMPTLLSDDHAGNYESALLLDPVTYASPAKVRQVLASAVAKEGAAFMHMGSGSATTGAMPLPGTFELMSCRLGMVTSWVFPCYKGDLSFGGCVHELQLPVMQDSASCPFSVAVIFRADKDRLAVLYVSKTIFGETLHGEDSPLSRETCV